MPQYYIQTRTEHGWHRIIPLPTYDSLQEATLEMERYIDKLFFEYGEIDIPTSIFRIVKVKPKKGGANVHEDPSVGALE